MNLPDAAVLLGDDRNILVSKPCSKTLGLLLNLLPPLTKYGPWIAGSAVSKTLKDALVGGVYSYPTLDYRSLNDVDVFFKTQEQAQKYLADLKALYPENVLELEPDFDNEAYDEIGTRTQTYAVHTGLGELRVQIITINFYSSMLDLINSFDFAHCQFATDGASTICYQESLDCLNTKTLEVTKITRPKSSVLRLCKYAKQGYNPSLDCLEIFAPRMS